MSATSGIGEQTAHMLELGHHFDQLAELLMSAESGPPDPGRVVRFAARGVPHTQQCGLTLVRKAGRPVTVAATGELSRRVDHIQYETGQGPCLEASEGHDLARAENLATGLQWPDFARRCVAETNVRSMFSLRLFLPGDDRAALNFYAERPGAFEEMDVAIGAMFAPFAALAVQNEMRAAEIDNLHTALQASRRIGVAIGILMARYLVPYEQAFGMLAAASQHLNRKLRDIAAEVAETGELPEGSGSDFR